MKDVTWHEISEGDQLELLSSEEGEMVDGAGFWSDIGWGAVSSAIGATVHWLWKRYF